MKAASTIFIAIDPGASGAAAVKWTDGSVCVEPFLSEIEMLEFMRIVRENADAEGADVCVFIEKVGGFVGGIGNTGSSMFNFGRNYGYYIGVCDALGFATRFVAPGVWQKKYPTRAKSAKEKAAHKRELKEHAARLYPKLKVTLASADALLILDWASA